MLLIKTRSYPLCY